MKIFKIEENDANQRLDKFLKKLFPLATRSLIYKFNRKDKIKVKFIDSDWKFKKRDNEYKLQVWDEVKIFLSDEEFKLLNSSQESWNNNLNKQKLDKKDKFDKNDIVFEDSDLFVVNKNAWLNVHSWDHKTKESNLIEQVQDYLWDKLNSLTFKPSLIHRIDRDTSWIVLIAKKKDILTKLVSDFKNHKKIKKIYYAIVLWKLSRKSWTIKKNLTRIENAKDENKVIVSEKWLEAITHYKLLKEYNLNVPNWNIIISEVEIQIETWRMHQIRVHMSSIWNPILWDKTYWDKKINAFLSRNYWLSRQALHSQKIEFFHYWRNKLLKLQAKIKPDLINFIKKITN